MGTMTRLDVAARLAARMVETSQRQVAEELHIPVIALLDMIEGKREFNRRVLRYLKVRREVIYYNTDECL